MKQINKKYIVSASILVVFAAICIAFLPNGEGSRRLDGVSVGESSKVRYNGSKSKKVRAATESRIVVNGGTRLADEIGNDEFAALSEEMKQILADIQACIDSEDRKALSKICDKIAKIQRERGEGSVPALIRAKAVEAIGLFLPASLAELVGFMADSDPEVVEAAFDQLDVLLNDTTIGDKDLSDMLVAISKVLTDEDSIDSMIMAIDGNMRNSVKVGTYIKILDSGTGAVVSKTRESIAELLEIEIVDLPADSGLVKQKLNEWLEEHPDGEDDADFYKGIDG